jgi:hypothetical protein
MAGIDYTIPGQFRGVQVESPMNAMAQAMQMRNLQESSQMNALKMREYQQQQQERNALAQLMGDSKLEFGSEPFMQQVLAKAPGMYEGIATRAAQRENLLAQREARQAETEKRQFESEKLKGQLSKEKFFDAVSDLTSYEKVSDVLSGLQQKLDAGQITEDQKNQVIAGLPDNDAEIPAWQVRTMRRLLTPQEKLADVRAERKDVREAARLELEGDRIAEQTRHANAMEAIGRAGADRAQLQLEETTRHNQAMEKLRRAEINKPAAVAAPTVTMVLDPNNPTQMLLIDAKLYKGGSLNSPGVIGIAGKEPTVGAKQADRETAQENAGTAIAQLRQSFDQLDKLGGITSTQNRAGTNVMAGLSSSGAGQFTGRLFGTEAQSQRNQIAQTRPLLMTSIMKAMGLSAKQLDSNAELKLWLSAATDPTLDIQSNRAALDNLENMLTGKGKPAPAAPKPKSEVRSQADAILGK